MCREGETLPRVAGGVQGRVESLLLQPRGAQGPGCCSCWPMGPAGEDRETEVGYLLFWWSSQQIDGLAVT